LWLQSRYRPWRVHRPTAVIPSLPGGVTASNRSFVEYTPGASAAVQHFSQVGNAGARTTNAVSVRSGRVIFCPQTCSSVRIDPMAKVAVRFTREIMIQ
jgi:hypothetical protein